MKEKLILFSLLCLLVGCISNEESIPDSIEGLRPIYAEGQDWQQVISKPAQPITHLGKMYYKDNLLYVVEQNRGFHVFNNTNPTNPEAIGFVEILACNDIAIKGNILYADNLTDLVAIDISSLDSVFVVSRTEDIYPESQQNFPESYSGYFECVDETKGKVLGWETALLSQPKCLR